MFVTHDQEEALTLSDRVAVMRAGRVEQIGGVEDIYHRPANLFVAQFVGEANVIGAVVVNTGNGRFVCQLTGDAEGYLEVQTSAKHPALETGTCVTLLVRPERIRLHADQPPADEVNALTVSVKERVFQGAATTLTLNVLASNVPMGLRALASHETRIAAAPRGRDVARVHRAGGHRDRGSDGEIADSHPARALTGQRGGSFALVPKLYLGTRERRGPAPACRAGAPPAAFRCVPWKERRTDADSNRGAITRQAGRPPYT